MGVFSWLAHDICQDAIRRSDANRRAMQKAGTPQAYAATLSL